MDCLLNKLTDKILEKYGEETKKTKDKNETKKQEIKKIKMKRKKQKIYIIQKK